MSFLEKNLEDIIFDYHHRLSERGLNMSCDCVLRQVNLGSYGIADIIAIEYSPYKLKSIHFDIVELKKDVVNVEALMQVCRYKTAIKSIVENRFGNKLQTTFRMILIGSSIDSKGDFVFLLNNMEDVSAYTYEYSFDGIRFSEDNKSWRPANTKIDASKIDASIYQVSDYIREVISMHRFNLKQERHGEKVY